MTRPPEAGAEHARIAPFDISRLDRLMDAAGLDILLVTSKHNVQYFLGDYRFFMFAGSDAVGLSRYLPVIVYPRGRPDLCFYVANPNERYEAELGRFWMADVVTRARGTTDAIRLVLDGLAARSISPRNMGVETAFLPADAWQVLQSSLPETRFADAVEVLEDLRAVKTPEELTLLRKASEGVVIAMAETFRHLRAGQTKHEVVARLRREENSRGLDFEYCLITAGKSLNRAPSDQALENGDIVSLDSGGNFGGYIGDLCRMGILGTPSPELQDALAQVEEIQQSARRPLRAGAAGSAPFEAVDILRAHPRDGHLSFVVHGMGLIPHEAPRLLDDGPIPYPAKARNLPLEAGMVLSIETTWQHPRLGFLKLEDTVAVTQTGCEAFGDAARGWNPAG